MTRAEQAAWEAAQYLSPVARGAGIAGRIYSAGDEGRQAEHRDASILPALAVGVLAGMVLPSLIKKGRRRRRR